MYSSSSVRTISRGELFNLVWEVPLGQVGESLGISDVAVRKICDRYDIPRPKQGHWARDPHRRKVRPDALPPSDVGEEIRIQVEAEPKQADTIAHVQIPAVVLKTMRKGLPKKRSSPVVETRKLLIAGYVDRYGFLRPRRGESLLRIIVTRSALERALTLLDYFLKVAAADGFELIPAEPETYREVMVTRLRKNDLDVELELKEKVRRFEAVPDPKKSWQDKYGYEPGGLLSLSVTARGRYRKTWSDNRQGSLEGKIEDIYKGLVAGLQSAEQERIQSLATARNYEISSRKRAIVAIFEDLKARRNENFNQYCESVSRSDRHNAAMLELDRLFSQEESPVVEAWQAWLADELLQDRRSIALDHANTDIALAQSIDQLRHLDPLNDSVDWSDLHREVSTKHS